MIHRERFEALLRTQGMTQADLARELGVTPSAVHQLLSGKTKSSRLTPKVAQIFRVPEDYLMGTSDDPYLPVSGTMTPKQIHDAVKDQHRGKAVSVGPKTVYVDSEGNQLPEGSNRLFEPSWLFKRISSFDPELVARKLNEGSFFPAIITKEVTNDAMSPTLMRGDEVIFSTDSLTVDVADGIWLLNYGGLLIIRRLTPLPDGKSYRVSGDNPASPTFEAPATDIQIQGRAFWVGRALA